MSRHLLIVCNSRSANLSLHEFDLPGRSIVPCGMLDLPVPPGEANAASMALNAEGTRLYLAWRGSRKEVLTFALAADRAALSLLGRMPLEDDICFLHFDAERSQLLAAAGQDVLALPLDEMGLPHLGARCAVGPMAHGVIALGAGRMLATACRGDVLGVIEQAGAGGFTVVQTIAQPPGSGPRHLCRAPNGRHAYLVSQESGEVVTLGIGPERVASVQRLPLVDDQQTGFAPMGGDIGITPDGCFVLATERRSNRLVAFAVAPETGLLTRLGWVPTPDYPRALAIDSSGKFLTVPGFRGHRASIFSIGPEGEMTFLADFATGERPSWVLSLPLP
ncbi:MAG: hypothetical protein ABS76_08980 [Pelagibacterium sp. SCN 64-44]|nr:MAG: hypothetical protein ABS76_08980 [Pelagibacterium sp. SCN 64-44]